MVTERVDAFISYARSDVAFVVRLVEGLRNANKRVWVDIEGLVAADEWWQRIKDAITAADHFVFILSPRSASSQVCLDEARLAVSLNKRVIPVLIADLAGPLPQVISGIHWLSFPAGSEDFSNGLEQLIQTMNTDPEWVRDHTRILTHASDWVQDGDPSRLLYGVQLSRASAWLLSYTETRVPAPTETQRRFIQASRLAEEEREHQTARAEANIEARRIAPLAAARFARHDYRLAFQLARLSWERCPNEIA